MPELVYDENALTLTAYPDTDVDLRAKIILLHGATAAVHHAGAWASGVAPGIWSVGGTADRLARKGFEVFVPEAEEGAGRPGDWLARACAWANKDGGPATVVGFSFGGSSAVLLARHAQDTTTDRQFPSVALGPLYLLDPALRSLAVGAALGAVFVALGADVLTGQAAVDAGLADGIATLEEVTAYALALAESGATTETIMDDEQDTPEDEDEGAKAMECAGCKTTNAAGAKFCNSCGVAMTAKVEDDAPPPSSKPMPAPPAATIAQPKAMPADASIASIVGASADSPLAVKTAAIKMRHDLDRLRATAAGITGKASIDEQIGAMLAIPSRLAKGEQAVKDQRAALAKAEATERAALVKRGVATGDPSMTAGRCYIPRVTADGTRTGTDIAPQFAEMKIGTLRGLVEGLEANAVPRNPFVEDKAAAKAASEAARAEMGNAPPQLTNGEPTAAQIARAVQHPTVQRMVNAPGNKLPVERIAKQFIIEAAKNGLSIGV